MVEPREKQTKAKAEEIMGRRRWVDSFALEGPWTDADEVWLECMTGDYDRRLAREASEREAGESDL